MASSVMKEGVPVYFTQIKLTILTSSVCFDFLKEHDIALPANFLFLFLQNI